MIYFVIAITALFWIWLIGTIVCVEAKSAAPGHKLKAAVYGAALFVGVIAGVIVLNWLVGLLNSSPPCFGAEQCDEFQELRQEGGV